MLEVTQIVHDRDLGPRGAARRDSPKSRDVRELRPLNQPVPIQVETDPDDRPIAVQRRGWPRPRAVVSVQDRWRIDDEWWRARPISRLYHTLLLEDGTLLTVYYDLVAHTWFAQRDPTDIGGQSPEAKVTRWRT